MLKAGNPRLARVSSDMPPSGTALRRTPKNSPMSVYNAKSTKAIAFPPYASETTMDLEKLISVTPGIRSGKPCIAGTRITVYDVLEYLAGGMTEQAILAEFPALTSEHIKATLAFAAQRERHLAA